MLQRRDLLKLTAGGLAAGVGAFMAKPEPALAQGQTPSDAPPYTFANVVDLARTFAKRPFQPASADLPAPFNNLGYDQYVAIRARPDSVIWTGDNVGF